MATNPIDRWFLCGLAISRIHSLSLAKMPVSVIVSAVTQIPEEGREMLPSAALPTSKSLRPTSPNFPCRGTCAHIDGSINLPPQKLCVLASRRHDGAQRRRGFCRGTFPISSYSVRSRGRLIARYPFAVAARSASSFRSSPRLAEPRKCCRISGPDVAL